MATDQYVRVQYSDDNGKSWSDWDVDELGEIGETDVRVVFTRQGSTRHRVYKIKVTSPRKRDLMGAVGVLQGTTG